MIIYIVTPCVLSADESEGFDLSIGRFYLSFTPKILEDGTQNDYTLGFFYTDAFKLGGEIRFRTINTTWLDNVWDIPGSVLMNRQEAYELFLLPANWRFFSRPGFNMRMGAGFYYNYNKAESRGNFNAAALFDPPGPADYSEYIYSFLGHAVGPMFDTGFEWRRGMFYTSFSAGVVPVFYLIQEQGLTLSPLMNPPSFSVSGESFSGPYYYLNLDVALHFKYISLFVTLFNEYSRLSYSAIGFDDFGAWAEMDVTETYRTFAFEVSLLINLGNGGIMPQIGYGRTFSEENGGRNYLLLGVKKFGY
jgi:hypothetical protein